MGAAGEYDDGGLRIAARLEQVEQLAFGLLQAVGRTVAGEHLRGQFEQDHQRVGGFQVALLQALPAGSE
ncbi:hypothetical protein D3C72_2329930 [compost metagenome]